MPTRQEFRSRIRRDAPELVFAPLCLDPMSALIAKAIGFDTVYVGGGGLGLVLGVSEALLTASEVAEATRRICDRVDVSVVVDGGVGFGDALHTARTVQMIERAGAHAIELEDQVAPKRVLHHMGIEHLVSKEEMVGKLQAAVEARRDPHFLIIARCNAMAQEGIKRTLDRCAAYVEAGADLLMVRTGSDAEFAAVSAGTSVPLAMLWGWSAKPLAELRAAGYALVLDSTSALVLTYQALKAGYSGLKSGAGIGMSRTEIIAVREEVQELIGINALYELERRTVEHRAVAPERS